MVPAQPAPAASRPVAVPLSEFEAYVRGLAGTQKVRRFGAELVTPGEGHPDGARLQPARAARLPGAGGRRGRDHDLGRGRCRPARDRRSLRPHQPAARRLDHAGRRALRRSAADHQQPRGRSLQEFQAQRLARPAARRACLRHRLRGPPRRRHRQRAVDDHRRRAARRAARRRQEACATSNCGAAAASSRGSTSTTCCSTATAGPTAWCSPAT